MTFPLCQAQALMLGFPHSVNSASANIPLSLPVPEFLIMSLRAILVGEAAAKGSMLAAVCACAHVCALVCACSFVLFVSLPWPPAVFHGLQLKLT